MKKTSIKVFFVLIIAIFLFSIVPSAQAALVQCDTSYAKTACEICDILELFKRVIDYITFTLTPIFAGILILIAGFMIVLGGASPEMISKGRTMLTNTVIGVFIIFGSFMITNFIIKSLAGDNDIAESW